MVYLCLCYTAGTSGVLVLNHEIEYVKNMLVCGFITLFELINECVTSYCTYCPEEKMFHMKSRSKKVQPRSFHTLVCIENQRRVMYNRESPAAQANCLNQDMSWHHMKTTFPEWYALVDTVQCGEQNHSCFCGVSLSLIQIRFLAQHTDPNPALISCIYIWSTTVRDLISRHARTHPHTFGDNFQEGYGFCVKAIQRFLSKIH